MTIKEAKQKLVSWCNAQVGYTEGANNWNKFAEMWTQAGGWNAQNRLWCDVFVDVAFIENFGLQAASKLTYQPVGAFSALCSASANYYKSNNAWFSTPAVGDQVFFNVSGGINHTGIVVGVTGGMVTCVEGNSSDAVRKNTYAVNNSYIAGFGRPNWEVFEDSGEPEPAQPEQPKQETCSVTLTLPVVKYGDANRWVKIMQTALISRGFSCGWYGADGDFGQQTKIGLFEFQKKNSLETDTVCGQRTWALLLSI